MKRKSLKETLELMAVPVANDAIIVDNMISAWCGAPYAPLSVMLVHLRFLAFVHQTHHWTAKGDPFYGDHLLFGRLYDGVDGEIDQIAEKAVGLGSIDNVNLKLQAAQLLQLVSSYDSATTIPVPSELAKRSLQAECCFLKCLERIIEALRETGVLTRGLDNMLAGIADKHEEHIYLLKQRCSANC